MTNYLLKYLALCTAWTVLVCSCCDDVYTYSIDLLDVRASAYKDGLEVNDTDTIPYSGFTIGLELDISDPVRIGGIPSIINQAYAFSCPNDHYVPEVAPEEIRVITLHDFNDNYDAGSVLPIVGRDDNSYHYFEEGNPEWAFIEHLVLDATPSGIGLHQFVLEMHMEDGSILQDTTQSMVLVP